MRAAGCKIRCPISKIPTSLGDLVLAALSIFYWNLQQLYFTLFIIRLLPSYFKCRICFTQLMDIFFNIWKFTEVESKIKKGVQNFWGEILSENVEISNVTAELWAILVRIETIKILERSIFQFHNLGFSSQMEKCQI